MSQAAFLRSTHTSEKFTGDKSQQQSFSRNLKKYDTGSWRPTKKFKTHKRLYVPLEDKLIKYLEARGQKFKRDKLGVSWNWLKVKCNEWAQQMDLKGFKCSDGWLHSTLKMHGFEHTKLHGEAEDMSEELRHSLMEPWRKNFHELIEELGCEMEHVYNADQTGLFYQKLPNGTYLRKGAKRTARGTKGMTDKARITLMICTSAAGRRVPIAVVGKSKKPVCFNLVDKVPLPYVNQSNAWFTAEITVWWINNVFWPFHRNEYGDVPCILVLDNCTAHTIDTARINPNIHIVFLPPKVTNKHQPADMGMIGSLKLGYRMFYLHTLLELFDKDGGFEEAAELRKKQKRGCKGIDYGGKPHILDAMEMTTKIWMSADEKYVSDTSVQRCWRKADILPATWNASIENNVGSRKVSKVDVDTCSDLCNMMKKIKIEAERVNLDVVSNPIFDDSFVTDEDFNEEEWEEIGNSWVKLEEDEFVMEAVVEEELEAIEKDISEVEDLDEEEIPAKKVDERKPPTCVEITAAVDTLRLALGSTESSLELSHKLDSIQRYLQKQKMNGSMKTPSIKSYFGKK